MTTQTAPATCGAARDVLPCVLDVDHGGQFHEDVNGYRWPTAAAMEQAAEDLRPAGMAALLAHVAANLPDDDQAAEEREPSAVVTLSPTADPDEITLAAESHGMNPARVAYGLRLAADEFDHRARAQGDEPIPYPHSPSAALLDAAREAIPAFIRSMQPTAPGWTLTPATLDTFLRALVNELDYDLHKSWESNEETGEDDYPKLTVEAGKMLDAITATAPEEPRTPAVGDRYVKRDAPDADRIVTVSRVWTADDGHTAVSYEWRDRGQCMSACPLNVFHRTYEAQQ
ncbi:hypothetical protein NGM36_13200 [Streptomyces mutabilis]|uniref:hypothetical protein n=1 Tax=Streptomyces mutabilis TaxID=67332 RepID=UPI0022BA3E87|nr:hypothetical protein [Streptomyces mutabilis]MCZ9350744.1 hypothetical protein [Streptomyces mutabilis]